jgi:5-methylcytosine-specific restriction endonuclease McrA
MAGNDRRLIRVDRRYNQPFRLTGHAYWLIFKWGGLLALVIVLGSTANYVGLTCMIAYLAYAGFSIASWSRRRSIASMPHQQVQTPAPSLRFNAPPGWPASPSGWTPAPDWQPDPSWPAAPQGWQFWVPDEQAPLGERNTRSIPQDVKIQVAARDGGRCRQCGSTEDLHYDHVIAWSKGGANTISNLQLLCGSCNRRKGADDIPAVL